MSYSDGSTFGYDELFVNPTMGTYADYNTNMLKPTRTPTYDNRMLKNIYNYENEYSKPRSRNNDPSTFNNVYDYLERSAKHCSDKIANFSPEIEELKKKLVEFQHKNDILLIFLVYLVIIIIMQYNMYTPYAPHNYTSPYINMRPPQ